MRAPYRYADRYISCIPAVGIESEQGLVSLGWFNAGAVQRPGIIERGGQRYGKEKEFRPYVKESPAGASVGIRRAEINSSERGRGI